MIDIHLVTADNLEGTMEILPPVLGFVEAKQKIVHWVEKQDRFWPNELTAEVLASSLREIYVAHWVLCGKATGTWHAAIGTDHTEIVLCSSCQGSGSKVSTSHWLITGDEKRERCSNCNGSGRKENTKTIWNNQSGYVTVSLDGKVIENIADNTSIKCGERARNVSGELLSKPFPTTISVLRPESTDNATGLNLAEQHTRQELERDANEQASNLGYVRDLRIANIRTSNVKAHTWLYPIYIGKYIHNEKPYLIEIDGITGGLYIPQPPGVVAKRVIFGIAVCAVGIAVILGLGLLLGWW